MDIKQIGSDAVIAAAVARAQLMGVPMNIAVFDAGANLKAFLRMDDALLGSADIALGKARTAALFGMNTEAIGEYCRPGGPSYGLENSNGGLVVFAGGVPLRDATGTLVGAVGVSGGSPDQDAAVANAAAAAFERQEGAPWSIGSAPGQAASLQALPPQS